MTVMPKTSYDRSNPLYHRWPEGGREAVEGVIITDNSYVMVR